MVSRDGLPINGADRYSFDMASSAMLGEQFSNVGVATWGEQAIGIVTHVAKQPIAHYHALVMASFCISGSKLGRVVIPISPVKWLRRL